MKSSSLIFLLLVFTISLQAQSKASTDQLLADDFLKVDQEPIPLNLYFVKDKIGYPAKALKKKIEGKVHTRIKVNPEGEVQEFILTRVDHPYLGDAVSRELDLLTFTPAKIADTAVNYWINVPFKFYLKETYRPKGQKFTYRSFFQRVFKSNIRKAEEYLTEGIALFEKRSYKDAGRNFKKCIQHTPKQKSFTSKEMLIQAYYYLAHAYVQLQSWDRALPYYTEAIGMSRTLEKQSETVDALLPSLYLGRGYNLLKVNEPARALQDYNYVQRHFEERLSYTKVTTPRIPNPWRAELDWVNYQKGLVYLQLEKNQDALENLTKVIELEPSSQLKQVALSHRGLVRSKLQDFEGAFNDIQAAIEMDDEDPQAYYLKAMVLMEVESHEMATELLEQAKELFAKSDNKLLIPTIYPANE